MFKSSALMVRRIALYTTRLYRMHYVKLSLYSRDQATGTVIYLLADGNISNVALRLKRGVVRNGMHNETTSLKYWEMSSCVYRLYILSR